MLTATALAATAFGAVALRGAQPPVQVGMARVDVAAAPAPQVAAAPAPPVGIAPGPEPAASGTAQARLVTAEDERIYTAVSEAPPSDEPYELDPVASSTVSTMVLTPRSRPYDLVSLERLGVAEELSDDTWLITMSVLVGRGAELRLDAPGSTLRLASGPDGFASLIAFKGDLSLAGEPGAPLSVTSWDPETQAPDGRVDDGRAYLRGVGGRMDLAEVRAADLGFWSGRTGGVAWTGATGEPGMGSATATTVERGRYGMFVGDVRDLVITGGAVRDNAAEGLLVHRGSTGVLVRGLESRGNAEAGIAVSSGTRRITVSGALVAGNANGGIRVDGAPLAEDASAGGAGTEPGRDFTIEGSTVADNAGVGVVAADTVGLTVRANTVTGSTDGIVVRGPTTGARLEDNTVRATDFGIAVRDGAADAQVRGNTVQAATIAVQVADAVAMVRGNVVETAGRYAVSLVGAVDGAEVADNRLGGRGPAAIDVNRVALGTNIALSANDEAGWDVDRDELTYWRNYVVDHPLLLLWLLILVLPVAAQLYARRRSRPADRVHPYAHIPPGPVPAAVLPTRYPPLTAGDHLAFARAAADSERTRADNPESPVESTTLLPVTRVTIVSGRGSAS